MVSETTATASFALRSASREAAAADEIDTEHAEELRRYELIADDLPAGRAFSVRGRAAEAAHEARPRGRDLRHGRFAAQAFEYVRAPPLVEHGDAHDVGRADAGIDVGRRPCAA